MYEIPQVLNSVDSEYKLRAILKSNSQFQVWNWCFFNEQLSEDEMSVQLKNLKTTKKEEINHTIRLEGLPEDTSEEEILTMVETKHGSSI